MSISRTQLLEYRGGTTKGINARSFRAAGRTPAAASVFLSHSHADREIVEPAANFLASLGVSVYVDWLDPEMPAVTNSETARRIRDKIVENRRFLVLVTDNSLGSRWVPWELGFADGKKTFRDIAILPVSEASKTAPSEYVQVYQRITRTDFGEWYIARPDESRGSTSVKQWLLGA